MDGHSHELFAEILLQSVNDQTDKSYGRAPDIDMTFFHRWYRHRISVIPKTFNEFQHKEGFPYFYDKNSVTMCILSHLYLDIFNGNIYPFGLLYPIKVEDSIIYSLLKEIKEPTEFIKDLKRLALGGFPQSFYDKSVELMKNNIVKDSSQIDITISFLRHITEKIVDNTTDRKRKVYVQSLEHIVRFTDNNIYSLNNKHQSHDDIGFATYNFERSYSGLIVDMLNTYPMNKII